MKRIHFFSSLLLFPFSLFVQGWTSEGQLPQRISRDEADDCRYQTIVGVTGSPPKADTPPAYISTGYRPAFSEHT